MYRFWFRKELWTDMKNDRGKIVLIAVLIACLALLYWVCDPSDTIKETKNSKQALENDTVSIAVTEQGGMFIGGEGKLAGADLDRLMSGKRLKKADIADVIVGDGLTEIGYSVCNGYKNLKTIKLGESVRVVHNGAVKNSEALEYIYLPSGLDEVGMDFLYGCGSPFLVTDGAAEDLPEIVNAVPERILANVRSYEDLVQRRAEVPCFTCAADAMTRDNPVEGDPTALDPDCSVTSPKFALEAGAYTLRLSGSGLDRLGKEDVALTVAGEALGGFEVADAGAESLACSFTLSGHTDAIQLRATNRSSERVEVTALSIYEDGAYIPPTVMEWWND